MADINRMMLFSNKHKTSPKAPDWHGTAAIEVAGKLYQIKASGWTYSSERAGQYLSLNFDVAQEPLPDAMQGTETGPLTVRTITLKATD